MPAERERRIRVMCVDDHPLIRKGIASLLANERDMELVGEAGDGLEAVKVFRILRPDVTLMDLRLPGLDGVEATKAILEEFPTARVIALTSYRGDQDVWRALNVGACGYLLKEAVHTDMLRAIRLVQSGRLLAPPNVGARRGERVPRAALTQRETEVLQLVADGLANKEIAEQLGSSSGTIKTHIEHILEKLTASDRTQAVTIALRRGIIHLRGLDEPGL
jgi:DNA-binding NarL/FixJ family response regulator